MNPLDTIAKTLSDGLYFLAFILDKIVYSFIPKLYKLIIYLANVDLFNGNPAVKALMNRVYILVGVFMLFKLAFSIVKYIVDPNAFSDQSRGFTNLVKRLLIALILLVSIPWLFEKVYEVQGKILSSNIIPNLILGTSDSEQSDIEETAKDVQFLIFGPFYTINPVGSLSVCDPSPDYPLSNIIGTTDMALISGGDCLTNLADLMDESDDVGATDVTIENFFGEKRDFSSLGALISVYEDNQRVVNYTPVVSTLCGGYLVFLLLSFCIDVGARAIKLLFLQILSPVAVISSVDPASSSQSDKLKDWGKECLSTFASLFLRLAVIYLVIQLVKVITAKLFAGAELYNEAFRSSADTSLNIFVYIFLILGAFQVAKKIPDLIEKAFGIKMSGELQLNPFKNPWVGAATGLGLAGASMVAANAIGAGKRIGSLFADTLDKRKAYKEASDNLTNSENRLMGVSRAYNNANRAYNEALRGFDSNPTEENFRKAEMLEKIRNRYAQQKAAAQEEYNRRSSEAEEATSEYKKARNHSVTQGASSIIGIGTGAVSGAVRGAQGAYGKGLIDSAKAASNARIAATDKRNDRDIRADTENYGVDARLKDAVAKFANVKSGKTYGVGQMDQQIKELRNELERVSSEMRAANEIAENARHAVSGISDSTLNSLIDRLNNAISISDRTDITNQITNALNGMTINANFTTADRDAVENLVNAVTRVDELMEQSVNINKQISQKEDATNAGRGGGHNGN